MACPPHSGHSRRHICSVYGGVDIDGVSFHDRRVVEEVPSFVVVSGQRSLWGGWLDFPERLRLALMSRCATVWRCQLFALVGWLHLRWCTR